MKKLFTLLTVLLFVLMLSACTKGQTVAPQATVDEAAALIYEYNKPGENNQLTASFTRVAVMDYDGYAMTVEWIVEGVSEDLVKVVPNADGTEVTIEVNKYAATDQEFTIKATVKSGTNTKTVEFTYTMKAYVISSWAHWAENPTDVTMNIKGVIIAKDVYSTSYNNAGIYLQDLDGIHGYYAYGLTCTQAQYNTDLAVGNVIEVTGTTSMYNNFREFGVGCTYSLVKDEEGEILTAEVVPLDITSYVEAETDLNMYQGNLVELKGFKVKQLEVATVFNETTGKGSLNITLEKSGVQIITRISTSNTYTYAALVETYEALAVGYTVDVVGPLAWYNAGQVYAIIDGITVVSTEVTTADYLDSALQALEDKYSGFVVDKDITLDATMGVEGHEATLTWVSKNTDVITNEGIVTLPDEETEVEFEVTLAIGDDEIVATIELIVQKIPVSTIASLIPLTPATSSDEKPTVVIEGVVIGHQYKGYWVADATGAALVWLNANVVVGTNAPEIGTVISLKGGLTTYGEANSFTMQISPIGDYTVLDTPAPTLLTPTVVTFDTLFGLNLTTYEGAKTAALTYFGKQVTITGTAVRMGNDNYWKIQNPTNENQWFRLNNLASNTVIKAQDGNSVTVTLMVRELYYIDDAGSYNNYKAGTFGGVYLIDADLVPNS